MKINKNEFFTIPNILSYIRILLIPIFMYVYINATSTNDYYIAAVIILISSITDFADGFIARKFNQVSELGKALDPISDKLTQAAIVLSLMFKIKGVFALVVILILKEAFMGINGLILLKKGKKLDGAMWFGKLSTAVFFITSFIIILFPNLSVSLIYGLLFITGFFLILSFVLYIPVFHKMYTEDN